MGKRYRKRNRDVNHFAQKKREAKQKQQYDSRDANGKQAPYEEIKRENEDFFKFYKHQNICASDEEWESFRKALQSNLPATFRITGSRRTGQVLLDFIKSTFFTDYTKAVAELREMDSEKIEPPKCLSWYPGELAWQLELTRKDIRRSEPLFRMHNFLISETASGNISRQEAVSMIPPIVLDTQPHHRVLDMCAAPGSKTAQIIEGLHSRQDNSIPEGFVIANDIDNKRCYMLVHQAKRLSSPCCIITNNDSTQFPDLVVRGAEGKFEFARFDRILCDVPCSGDGTMRKNPDIWLKWNVAQSINLHPLQYRIVKRGAELLAIGGRLVYSTCSLNPIENEAIVQRLLADSEGALELVDIAPMLPGLKYSPGLTSWEACGKDFVFYESFDKVPESQHALLRPYMFPGGQKETAELKKCLRILPHHQNTGAFFVAAFEKRRTCPWEEAKEPPQELPKVVEEPQPEPEGGSSKRQRMNYGFREDPFVFFDPKEPIFASIKEYYGLKDDFKAENLLTRCKVGKKRNLYFCSDSVRNIVAHNEHHLKIINTGIKAFARCDNKNMACDFRVAQEGIESVIPFLGDNRCLSVERDDLVFLLQNLQLPPDLEKVSEKLREQAKKLTDQGSCIFTYSDDRLTLHVAGWKGVRTIKAYMDVNDAVHNLRLLGADTSKYETNKFKKADEVSFITNSAADSEAEEEEAPVEYVPA